MEVRGGRDGGWPLRIFMGSICVKIKPIYVFGRVLTVRIIPERYLNIDENTDHIPGRYRKCE